MNNKIKRFGRDGFTLLEILVVIVILAILMGLTFRLSRSAESAKKRSKIQHQLNALNAAISEFHAEYGRYPSVDQLVEADDNGIVPDPLPNDRICDARPGGRICYVVTAPDTPKTVDEGPFQDSLTMGLISFFVDRTHPTMSKSDEGPTLGSLFINEGDDSIYQYLGKKSAWAKFSKSLKAAVESGGIDEKLKPSDRDLAFFKRVKPILEGVVSCVGISHFQRTVGIKCTITDDKEDAVSLPTKSNFVYICPPPYTTYALFHVGEDKQCVYSDPLNRNAECPKCNKLHNFDNIYGTIDDKK